jgi:thioredoxin-related protein
MKYIILFLITFTLSTNAIAHSSDIAWKTWAELEQALKEDPKPVFIYFHASWCAYCKKIKRDIFTKKNIINTLNHKFYAVEMDIETTDTITFDGVTFTNQQARTKRNGIHQLPLLLASTDNKTVTLPATLLCDSTLSIKKRIFSYYTSKTLLDLLNTPYK